MYIKTLSLHPYAIALTNGQQRKGTLLSIVDGSGVIGWGDVAPLPHYSLETLQQAMEQCTKKREEIMQIDWCCASYAEKLNQLNLFPSLQFGLESALLSILSPLPEHVVTVSALLMGSPSDILNQAAIKKQEGYTSIKLKVGHLTFGQAEDVIYALKDTFYLRIDVNRAWETVDSLRFFSQFPTHSFDYVEEPFRNPQDLYQFSHPLAIDESFPRDLSLEQLESLPALKAIIYKPTIQGGMAACLPLCQWAKSRGIQIVLSSSFESDVGIFHIASMARRLALVSPLGIGTYDYLTQHICMPPLQFSDSVLHMPHTIGPL